MKKSFTFLGILFSLSLQAQHLDSTDATGVQVPMSNGLLQYIEAPMQRIGSGHFTSVKPFLPQQINSLKDSVQRNLLINNGFAKKNWFGRKIFNEDLFHIHGSDFAISINPIVNINIGKDNNWTSDMPFQNTRGVRVEGKIGKNFNFETEYFESQARFPKYVHDISFKERFVFGMGGLKEFKTGNALDYLQSAGAISYRPNKFFHFSFGQGKHFWGDGYRSLLLSDNASTYPYFKIVTDFWKIRYVNLWAQMLDKNQIGADGTYARKYVNSHYLSYDVTKRLNISLFESVVYQDSLGTRRLDLNYLNPIIFYRPIEFALNSNAGNVILGANLKYKLTNEQLIYGQFLLDEFNFQLFRQGKNWWGNKFGYQLGFKSFNTFIPNLMFQTEFNMVRPYTYSHGVLLQNYGHYSQPLAHPLGGNFKESVTNIRYFKGRFSAEAKVLFVTQGLDSLTKNYGSNIYRSYNLRPSDFDVFQNQGIKATTFLTDFRVGYLVNPRTNLKAEIGATFRSFTPEKEIGDVKANKTTYVYFGIRSDLYNFYHDF
jgi:hypothetical protein